jgi:hypothetical protein
MFLFSQDTSHFVISGAIKFHPSFHFFIYCVNILVFPSMFLILDAFPIRFLSLSCTLCDLNKTKIGYKVFYFLHMLFSLHFM